MQDASEENDTYYKSLASKVSGYLPGNAHVCDAGCGLGYLSIALSSYCKHITAVDIAPQALEVLRNKLKHLDCGNIGIIRGDIRENPPSEPYDAMIFCFFAGLEEALKIAKKQCSGTVIMIKKNWDTHRFSLSPKALERFTFTETLKRLGQLDIPHKSETFALEMGQPFDSIEAAVEFFQIYSRDDRPQDINAEAVAGKLVCRSSGRFPYYLPSLRQMGMIILKTADIPDYIEKDIEEE